MWSNQKKGAYTGGSLGIIIGLLILSPAATQLAATIPGISFFFFLYLPIFYILAQFDVSFVMSGFCILGYNILLWAIVGYIVGLLTNLLRSE